MSVRNRELSQFGSFIYIDDSTKSVGITTTVSPNVGIGTTNATHKLTVIGDTKLTGNTNVIGIISATSFYLNGSPLVDVDVASWSISGFDIYRESGNVGIGTTIPSTTLDIGGNVRAAGIITASRFISTVTTGTSPLSVLSQTLVTNLNADYLRGKTPPVGDIIGSSDTQALTNKTLNLSSNTLTGTLTQFNTALSDDDFVGASSTQTITNKTLTTPIITEIRTSVGSTQTVPTGIGTLVSTNSVGVVTTGMISDQTIMNADINSSAAIAITKLAASTISGVSLGSTLNNLTTGSFITYDSGTTYNGSAAKIIGVAGTTINTANTLVARDSSGDFNAGTINCAYLNATFDINSNSDENLKTNIKTVENALDTINSIRGVTFEWRENGRSSVGIIAQELEKVLPQLISYNGENKAVNYNGIIGVLIEAIKELSEEVQQLKTKVL